MLFKNGCNEGRECQRFDKKSTISQVFIVALELRALAFTPLLPGRGARGDAHRSQGGSPSQFGLLWLKGTHYVITEAIVGYSECVVISNFKASKLGVLVATDDTGVVTRLYREALSFIDASVEHLVCSGRFIFGIDDFSHLVYKLVIFFYNDFLFQNSGAGLRHLATGKVAIGSRGVAGVEVGSLLLANDGICCLGDIGERPVLFKFVNWIQGLHWSWS